MNREQQRVKKYLKNQRNDSKLKKRFNFDSIMADPEPVEVVHSKTASGQVTGKFRSLNEPMISSMLS